MENSKYALQSQVTSLKLATSDCFSEQPLMGLVAHAETHENIRSQKPEVRSQNKYPEYLEFRILIALSISPKANEVALLHSDSFLLTPDFCFRSC